MRPLRILTVIFCLLGESLFAGSPPPKGADLPPVAKTPNSVPELSDRGLALYRAGKVKEAEVVLKRALEIAPEDSICLSTLGMVYFAEGKYDDAVNKLTKALAIDPKNATAHNYLGITASQKGWEQAAEKELVTATTLDPNYADAHFNLAMILATKSPPDLENARRHYQRAIELGAERDEAFEKLIGLPGEKAP